MADTIGLVTQFGITPVPEPSIAILAVIGLGVPIATRLRTRSRRHTAILKA